MSSRGFYIAPSAANWNFLCCQNSGAEQGLTAMRTQENMLRQTHKAVGLHRRGGKSTARAQISSDYPVTNSLTDTTSDMDTNHRGRKGPLEMPQSKPWHCRQRREAAGISRGNSRAPVGSRRDAFPWGAHSRDSHQIISTIIYFFKYFWKNIIFLQYFQLKHYSHWTRMAA